MLDRFLDPSAKRTVRDLVTAPLVALRRSLSTGRTNALIRRLGLQPALVRVYWTILFFVSRGRYTQEVGPARVTVDADSPKEYRHYRTLVDERPVLEDLLERLESDDVFYDVGGYVGAYACLAADVLPPGQVVSFEPRPEKAARIEANLAYNDLDATVRRHGLSDRRTEHTIGGDGRFDDDAIDGQDVSTVAGDDLVRSDELPAPTVLKIDVEGHEMEALEGLSNTIDEHVRLVYCELHPSMIDGIDDDVREFLEERGFDVEPLHVRGEESLVRARRAQHAS